MQEAFDLALLALPVPPPQGREIWASAGTYTPNAGSKSTNFRNATFALRTGLAVFGGFAGWETDLSQRDPEGNPTVLSGDLNGDDEPNFANRGDNSYHVVTATGTGPSAVLDGFIIKDGYAHSSSEPGDRGGGLIANPGSPTLRNLTFTDNSASNLGGGSYFSGQSNPFFDSCLMSGN